LTDLSFVKLSKAWRELYKIFEQTLRPVTGR
jgi:hypothetical protein